MNFEPMVEIASNGGLNFYFLNTDLPGSQSSINNNTLSGSRERISISTPPTGSFTPPRSHRSHSSTPPSVHRSLVNTPPSGLLENYTSSPPSGELEHYPTPPPGGTQSGSTQSGGSSGGGGLYIDLTSETPRVHYHRSHRRTAINNALRREQHRHHTSPSSDQDVNLPQRSERSPRPPGGRRRRHSHSPRGTRLVNPGEYQFS